MGKERQAQLRQLLEAAETMLQGTISETMRTCGSPGCHCHRGELHGPHTYLTFKKPGGRSSGLYVPVAARAEAEAGVAAWKRFWELAAEIATSNRLEASARWKAESRRRRKGGAADVSL
jgi:hypothetical protein